MESNPTTSLLLVDAGAYDREDCLVHAQLDAPRASSPFEAQRGAVPLVEIDAAGQPLQSVPAQLDRDGRLTWLMAGHTAAGQQRRYRADLDGDQPLPANLVDVATRGDHLLFSQAGKLITRYIYLGVWKPYFYPIVGPYGSVVRGASGEHQHQTGLMLGYGGHGEGGSTNIWSDWDEPPYGPCGKMLHGAFDLVRGGPVYGHIIQQVSYIRPDGAKILDERRDLRVYPLPGDQVAIDITIRAPQPDDPGARPFIVSARVADTIRVRDHGKARQPDGTFPLLDPPGLIENSEGGRGEKEADRQQARWCDYSGQTGDGWSGIALFDHPDNYEYPGRYHAGNYGCLSVTHHYPQEVPASGYVTWTVRALAHAGDVQQGKVASRYQDFITPPQVTVATERPAVLPH